MVLDHDPPLPLPRTPNEHPSSYGDAAKYLAVRAGWHNMSRGRRCPLTQGSPFRISEWGSELLRRCHPPSGINSRFSASNTTSGRGPWDCGRNMYAPWSQWYRFQDTPTPPASTCSHLCPANSLIWGVTSGCHVNNGLCLDLPVHVPM